MGKRVAVAMSGGVDSSVTAYLLKEAGYEVIGLTMDLLQSSCMIESPTTCCSLQAFQDAKEVADELKINHYIIDCKAEFETHVINYFINEYLSGRTPNPCIVCNKIIKFGFLLKKAQELRADYLATGHYAKVIKQNSRYVIQKGIDLAKDQSYFLYSLSQTQLTHAIMPLGEYKKEAVRKIANDLGLKVHDKPESQQICFITEGDYRKFISERLKHNLHPGPILNKTGKVLGEHQGIAFFTIGQRRGLNIAFGKPIYVIKIDKDKNAIIVGEETDLYSYELVANNINWVSIDKLTKQIELIAKIRYLHDGELAEIFPLQTDMVKVRFKTPQRAITPGQSVVFYQGDILVGGGVIKSISNYS
jgi:tRNA-specific 2-thiouridylase